MKFKFAIMMIVFAVVSMVIAEDAFAQDWWRTFHKSNNRQGYTTSSAPSSSNTLWSYSTAGNVVSSPAVVGNRVYVGSNDNKVYCLDAFTNTVLWTFTTGDDVLSSPAVYTDRVFVGSMDGNVYCLPQVDPNGDGVIQSHEVIWTSATGEDCTRSPVALIHKVSPFVPLNA